MRQILNVGFHLFTVRSICKVLVGPAKKVFCKKSRRAKEFTEVTHSEWLEGVKLYGIKKRFKEKIIIKTKSEQKPSSVSRKTSDLQMFKSMFKKKNGMIYSL